MEIGIAQELAGQSAYPKFHASSSVRDLMVAIYLKAMRQGAIDEDTPKCQLSSLTCVGIGTHIHKLICMQHTHIYHGERLGLMCPIYYKCLQ